MSRRGVNYWVVILLCIQACKTEDGVKPVATTESKCYLVKSTSTYSSSPATNERVYTLNSNGKVTEVVNTAKNGTTSATVSEKYTYDSSGKLTKVEGATNNQIYTYTPAGQLSSVVYYSNNTVVASTTIQYNSSGQIEKKIYANNYSGLLTYTGYRLYTYLSTSSKNASKETLYDTKNEIQFYVEYEYDTRFNPLASIGIDQSITVPAVNNITQSTYTQLAGLYSVNVSTNTYTYNDKGYPTEAVRTAYGNTETIVYEYSCQ